MDALSRYLVPPPRFRGRLWLFTVGILLITGGLGVGAYLQYQRAESALARQDAAELARAKATLPEPTRSQQDDHKRWAALMAERDFAWEPLFLAIEHSASNDIELLEFQPDKNNKRVILRGEARDGKALVSFLSALAAQTSLGNVHLSRKQTTERVGFETVTFEIKATLIGY